LTHEIDVAHAFEAVISAAAREIHEIRHQVPARLAGVDEMRHAEAFGQRLAPGIDVDTDDLVRAREARALDYIESDPAQPEDNDVRAGFDFGRVDDGADACRHPAADVTNLVEWSIFTDLRHRDLRQHGVVRERRASHVMMDLLTADRETAGAVRHHALS